MKIRNLASRVFFGGAVLFALFSLVPVNSAAANDGICSDGNRQMCASSTVRNVTMYYYWV